MSIRKFRDKILKSINHKGHKGITQRSQSAELQGYVFVNFEPSLSSLWLNVEIIRS
jgi:hypothetical protein